MIYMFLSNNPLSGDINSSNLSCFILSSMFAKVSVYMFSVFSGLQEMLKN